MNAINKNPHIKKLINKLTFKLICKIEWGKVSPGNRFINYRIQKKMAGIRASDLFKIPRPTELKS